MTELRQATVDDLSELVRIHKLAYSKSHFTALLPDEVLMRYYGYFLDEGAEIWLAVDDSVHYEGGAFSVDEILGFSVFGVGIPEKIAIFKRECRLDILLASLLHPLRAAKKFLEVLISRLDFKRDFLPAEFLLLSIAVANPRRGVGRRLMNAMLSMAAQKKYKSVGLYVKEDNIGAINSYFSVGFVILHFQGGQFYMEKILE